MIKISLKDKVEDILKRYPQSRDCDVKLCNAFLVEYHRESLRKNEDGDLYIRLIDRYNVTSDDDIIRLRRVLQNKEGKYLPSENIKQKRFEAECISRTELGYPSANFKLK